MNYRIEDIPLEGVLLEGELEKGWLEKSLQDGEGFPASSAPKTSYRLHVSRSGTTVFVRGTIKTDIEVPCSRCTERFVLPLTPEFRFSLVPVSQESSPLTKRSCCGRILIPSFTRERRSTWVKSFKTRYCLPRRSSPFVRKTVRGCVRYVG